MHWIAEFIMFGLISAGVIYKAPSTVDVDCTLLPQYTAMHNYCERGVQPPPGVLGNKAPLTDACTAPGRKWATHAVNICKNNSNNGKR